MHGFEDGAANGEGSGFVEDDDVKVGEALEGADGKPIFGDAASAGRPTFGR